MKKNLFTYICRIFVIMMCVVIAGLCMPAADVFAQDAPGSGAASEDAAANSDAAAAEDAGQADDAASADVLKEGSFLKGRVIVKFNISDIKAKDAVLDDVRASENFGAGYGKAMTASGGGDAAAKYASGQAGILEDILGEDFVIEDALVFPAVKIEDDDEETAAKHTEGFIAALVSSEEYKTEELIEKLSSDKKVAAVEPDSYIIYEETVEKKSSDAQAKSSDAQAGKAADELAEVDLERYSDYMLNDTYAPYLYQANSPLANNIEGKSVAWRDAADDLAETVSINAGAGWGNVKGDEKETVAAVIDSGINIAHEDLRNMLWTNPGGIGLQGEHGYNFASGTAVITDQSGHGSHVAGIIAAEANNDRGVAGITSGAKVRIMMLGISSNDTEPSLFTAMKAYNYVIRAREAGVNITVTNNSWSCGGRQSSILSSIVDRAGESGILSFFAAGNAGIDMDADEADDTDPDKGGDKPDADQADADKADADNAEAEQAGSHAAADQAADYKAPVRSQYAVIVGAADIAGNTAGFGNTGKASVDIFAPGVNILSTAGGAVYFPALYSKDALQKTTEYYGIFNDEKLISEDGTGASPDTGAGGTEVKSFEKSVFRQQSDDDAADAVKASCELSTDKKHYFGVREDAASLKVTIKNAAGGQQYYFYFPYKKNEKTDGTNGTRYSIVYKSGDIDEGVNAAVTGGEILVGEDGKCSLPSGSAGHSLSAANKFVDSHLSGSENAGELIAADKLDGRTAGIGLCISTDGQDSAWKDGKTHDLTFYIDSIAVSKPDAEIDPESSYEIMSGTSMACSAAAGAGALIAALEPIDDVQTGAEYTEANRSKLMECVRKTDRLAGKCAAGGFADLTLLSSDDADGPAGCGEEDAEEEYDPDYNDKYTLDYREE